MEAIYSCLKQSLSSLEVIVYDDASTDGTDELIKTVTDERVHYFRSACNNGEGRRWGLNHARGKYITFLDHDDYYTDYDFFRKAIAIHEEHEHDGKPLAFVCANARWHNEITGERRIILQWPSDRADGINDYILNHNKYIKPLSTFPTVFRADLLKQAIPEGRSMSDSLLYLQTAMLGDAWYMPDIVGVYRVHGANESNGVKNNPAYNARYLTATTRFLRTRKVVRNELYTKADRKLVDRWYTQSTLGTVAFNSRAHSKLKDKLKIYKCVFREAELTPKQFLILLLNIPKYMLKDSLRKITPIRKLYRFIKYRLRGRPYLED